MSKFMTIAWAPPVGVLALVLCQPLWVLGGELCMDQDTCGLPKVDTVPEHSEAMGPLQIDLNLPDGQGRRIGAARFDSICRLTLPTAGGTGYGTGFWIRAPGSQVHCLMTNNNVLADKEEAKSATARFGFRSLKSGIDVQLDPDTLFYTNPTLDMTIVAFDPAPLQAEGWQPLQLTTRGKLKKDQPITIKGHPGGEPLQEAFEHIAKLGSTTCTYQASTLAGMSGSPVFDSSWDVVLLHTAGQGSLPGNKGYRILDIVKDIKAMALRGGWTVGEEAYYVSSDLTFPSGNRLAHNAGGLIAGPDLDDPDRVLVQFNFNKGLVGVLYSEISRTPHAELRGGWTVGEPAYFIGSDHTFPSGNKLAHNARGVITGPLLDHPDRVELQFDFNKGRVSVAYSEISRTPHPGLRGGWTVGERAYFVGRDQRFPDGDKLAHNARGVIAGPVLDDPDRVELQFVFNKDPIGVSYSEISRKKQRVTKTSGVVKRGSHTLVQTSA